MAAPITSIKKKQLTEEELKQQKLDELQSLIAEQEEAFTKMLQITGELNDSGMFDALKAMVEAKDEIAKIAVDQVSREPVKNLINHAISASGAISSIDPAITAKLADSMKSGLDHAQLHSDDKKIGVFQLMSSLNDPDVNRAIKFGLNFLKGMGKELGQTGQK